MEKNEVTQYNSQSLRSEAEEILKNTSPEDISLLTEAELLKLIHELRVHQVELELQNEELRRVKISESEAVKLTHKLEVFQVELESQNEELRSANALAKDATDLYELAPTGYFSLSGEGEILRLNLSGAEILGKDRSQLIHSRFAFFVSDETRPVFNLFLKNVFSSKTKQSCEITLLTSGNAPLFIHITGISTGNAEYCLTTVTDISGLKKAEIKLNDSRVFLDTVIEHSPHSLWISDKYGTLLRMNQACREILHLKDDEVVNKYNVLLDSNIEEQGFMPLVRDVFEKGKSARFVSRYNTATVKGLRFEQTTKLALDINISPILDSNGNITNAVIQHIDITERLQAEEALKESEERYRNLFENTGTAVIIIEEDTTISFANDEFANRVGFSRSEIEGKKSFTEFVDSDAAALLLGQHKLRRENPADTMSSYEFRYSTKSGELRYALVNAQLLPGSKQSMASLIDITERRQTQDELTFQNDLLSKITQFSIDLSMFPATANMDAFIAKRIKEITGASAVAYSEYKAETQMIVTRHIEVDPGLLKKAIGLLGNQIQDVHSPVDEETYRKITENIIGRYETITELSFGAIPRPVGSILSALIKADRYIGIAYLIEGKLYGTSVLALNKKTPDPSDEVLKNIAFLVAVSLRRKQAEEALLNEQWRLASIIEGTHVGTWEWNVQTGETIFNEQWASIIGYSLDELEPLNISVWEKYTHPDDLKQSAEILQKHFTGELPYYECECRMKHKDGHFVWVHDRGSVITRTGDGKPLMMFGTHTDITERMSTEKALKESQANLAAIFNATDESVILVSADETILAVNETTTKHLGLSPGKVTDKKVHELMSPEVLAYRRTFMKKVLEKAEPAVFEDFNNGRWFINRIYPILDRRGKVNRMAIFARDITEQKQTANALRETEARFRLAADNAPVLIWQSDTDGLCNYFNQPWLNFTGRTFEQESGNGWAEGVHPDDLQSCLDIYMNSFAQKRPFEMEYRLRRADGEYRWLMDHGIPRFAPDGEFLGYIGSCFDITESKQVKDELLSNKLFTESLLNAIPAPIFYKDKDGHYLGVNKSFEKFYGTTNDKFRGKTVFDIATRDLAEVYFAQDNELLQNQGVQLYDSITRDNYGNLHDVVFHKATFLGSDGEVHGLIGMILDVTEHKVFEKALLKSKEQYDKLAANIPVGVYVLNSKSDGSFKLDYASPRMAEMLGLDVESLLNNAGLVFNTIHPDDRDEAIKLNSEGITLRRPFDWTGRIQVQDSTSWMHFMSLPELQENGDVLWHGLIVDITKEKLAEDALTEAHNRLLKIARLLPGVVYQYKLRSDGTSCFPYSSDGIKDIFHVSPDEILEDASKMFTRIHPDDVDGFIASMQASAEKNAPWEHEFKVKYDDGTVRTLFGSSMPQKEQDGSVLWHGFVSDITERKQSELALIESETRFKNLFEHHSAIMLLIDPASGLIIDANAAAAEFYGYSKSVLQSMNIEEINILTREQVKVEREKAKINKLNYFIFQHRLASGEVRTVEVHSSPIGFQEKQILFSIIHDITERKLAENEIQIKNEELLKVNAEKDKFFSIIAHDLRGPIGGFMGLTEKMAEGMADMTLDELQNIARVMKKSSTNLYNLLGNLLEWSRMQRGLTVFEPVNFLLMPKIHEFLLLTLDSARKKEIEISNAIPAETKVFADENMLACIIRNLVANAVKFTPLGGKIGISAEATEGRFIEISITDTGIGMNKNISENLFNLDVNTSRKGTDGELSTGLGLMICKDFIEKHGGELRVESEVGKGSTFKFTIPVNPLF